jgi:histidinol dehydrogenase
MAQSVKVELKPQKVCNAGKRKDLLKVGLYIPGGTAPLFSTVLMLAVLLLLQVAKSCVLLR